MADDEPRVCKKCGWYEHSKYSSVEKCDPPLGRFVDELFEQMPASAEKTKLGYGERNFAIKWKDVTLVFQAYSNRTCRLDRVFGLDMLTIGDVDFLMEAVFRIRGN